MSENYLGIMAQYITLHGKVEIYRDTGVSKNIDMNKNTLCVQQTIDICRVIE